MSLIIQDGGGRVHAGDAVAGGVDQAADSGNPHCLQQVVSTQDIRLEELGERSLVGYAAQMDDAGDPAQHPLEPVGIAEVEGDGRRALKAPCLLYTSRCV